MVIELPVIIITGHTKDKDAVNFKLKNVLVITKELIICIFALYFKSFL